MDPLKLLSSLFKEKGLRPFPFQRETWKAALAGKSGLLHAPTGMGKTLAVWLGPVAEAAADSQKPGCKVLWITPLRALAQDTQKSLQEPLDHLGLKLQVGIRTGDTSAYQKAKLNKSLPFCLITTPESLSLFLTHDNFRANLADLDTIIIDEWHELIGTKRGVQTELCLARLRKWFPNLRIWGLSATLGNIDEAKRVLLGSSADAAVTISGTSPKKLQIKTVLPRNIDRFPWSGHIGIQLLPKVIKLLEKDGTTLLFTNTRSQTEIWFQALLEVKPEWQNEIALHHGSIDREERALAEDRLRDGSIRCVICTSSLDLGVDFSPVTQVIQIGSPKGIARLMQRAGRSGHQPGGTSRLHCVPGNAFELVEFAAARDAIAEKNIEARLPLHKPLDVLVQHLVTICIGEPTSPSDLLHEVRSTFAYQNLTEEEWQWALDFVTIGGKALAAYPNFKKATLIDGKLTITDKRLIQRHRLSIGTITDHPTVSLAFRGGRRLGSVEESFISKIRIGGVFIFGGQRLELIRIHKNKATVKRTDKKAKGEVAIWGGARMPLSSELSHAVAQRLKENAPTGPEMKLIAPILDIQKKWSRIPHDEILLLEKVDIRSETHLFVYTFAGRLVNEGLGSLIAWRISQNADLLIQVTMNDYGFGLTTNGDLPFEPDLWRELLTTDKLLEDLLACMNTAELARRQFRDIARVSGLVLQQLPRRGARPQKDLQTSSRLLYEVFQRYDPDNLLLVQARREILDNQLELTRLKATMEALAHRPLHLQTCARLTPMAFPLWADRLQAHYQGQDATTRLEQMLTSLETAAG
ncbi:MAG: ligase-associated DNA damage response DEXH box helicase [Verrucomicrobiaceae bacterium]